MMGRYGYGVAHESRAAGPVHNGFCEALTNLEKETFDMLKKLMAFREAYLRDESGATAIEYGMIAAGIAVVVVGLIAVFGPAMEESFTSLAEGISSSSFEE
jgi:pilus assembly protein Flp/PilA